MADWSIQLDSTELVNSTYNVAGISDDTTAERIVDLLESAGIDGGVIVSDRFGTKTISISGILIGTSASDLQTKIDALNELFSRKDKNLDITPPSGTLRRYVVRMVGSVRYDRRYYHNDYVPFRADFLVPEGVGKASSSTSAYSELNKALERVPASGSDELTFLGSAQPKPLITITIDTLGKLDLIKVLDDDNTRELAIEIDSTYATGDILKIDLAGETVIRERAGVDTTVPYRGQFPKWVLGANDFHTEFQGASYVIQESNAGSTGDNTYVGDAGGVDKCIAQSFIATESGYIDKIALRLGKNNTPGDLQFQIYSDSGGFPYQRIATPSGYVFPEASIPSSETTTEIEDSSPTYYVRKGQKYWLVLSTGVDTTDNLIHVYGQSTSAYADGQCLQYTGGTTPPSDPNDWVVNTDVEDIWFRLYRGQGGAINWQADIEIDYTKRYL